jgi:hypothetical protein
MSSDTVTGEPLNADSRPLELELDVLHIEGQGQYGRFSSLDTPPIHKRRTIHQRRELLGTATLKIGRMIDEKSEDGPNVNVDCRHPRVSVVQAREAINPGIHILAIERRKAKCLDESRVKSWPI